MRVSEWICVFFLALFIALAFIRPLRWQKRLQVIGLGIAGLMLLWFGTIQTNVRDWVPVLILLFVYWQGGSFFSQPNGKLQTYLERFDENFFRKWPVSFHSYWEVAYFFCYPLVPGAIGALYALGLREKVDFFWTVVLPPTFLCHLVVSFYQTHPPWKSSSTNGSQIHHHKNGVRRLNFLVIRHASIQLNTFPSAHVASSVAIACAMLQLHWISGLLFLFLAISIAISTVIGRYHFVADAILGFFLAICWYGIVSVL